MLNFSRFFIPGGKRVDDEEVGEEENKADDESGRD